MSEELFERLTKAIIDGKEKDVVSFCREAVEKGLTARSVLERGLRISVNPKLFSVRI